MGCGIPKGGNLGGEALQSIRIIQRHSGCRSVFVSTCPRIRYVANTWNACKQSRANFLGSPVSVFTEGCVDEPNPFSLRPHKRSDANLKRQRRFHYVQREPETQ